MPDPGALLLAALGFRSRGQLVRLAEKAAASAVLWSFALVVRHGSRLAWAVLGYVVCPCVYSSPMAERNRRINVTLEPDYAQKLATLAERSHVQEGTLARSLLSSALDEADPDASRITEILDGIPGAWERTQESIEQARRGETVPLSEL
jgi:hypothetical protein